MTIRYMAGFMLKSQETAEKAAELLAVQYGYSVGVVELNIPKDRMGAASALPIVWLEPVYEPAGEPVDEPEVRAANDAHA